MCVSIAALDAEPYKENAYAHEREEGHSVLVLRETVCVQGSL